MLNYEVGKMKKKKLKLTALDSKEREITSIQEFCVDSAVEFDEIDGYLFVKVNGILGARENDALIDVMGRLMRETGKTVVILPSSVEFFRAEEVSE